jgi:CRP-like cAMP-binding protein
MRTQHMLHEGNKPIDILPEYTRKFLKDPPLLLKNFHYEDVLAFLKMGKEERYMQGDVIIKDGEVVSCAYLVAEGNVSIWKENIQLAELEEGSFLGESFLFSKVNRLAKVQADSETVLLKYERYEVLNFFRKRPEKLFNIFTKNIIEIQQRKVHNMNMQLIKLKKRLLGNDEW